ncbi:YihY/virulence factor BrkB family protein [Alicyclobacillus tolerans]|uniref:YihY/virulence factor BrkB family protein n=1 Tax=Alicyclobacillus tolerans TaxID=90970 RepID=UPI001F2EC332|nr:YihY/virulence factor BrkB family protein [Alicyclobacillus tolerans]MCF8566122.1 YihY/virulence factor BrkB family protein [Alicyclobacillus tolerans]
MQSSFKSIGKTIGQFLWRLTLAVVRHDIATLAAVIAFYAAFSLFPLVILVVYATSFLPMNANVEKALLLILRPYFPAVPQAREFIALSISRLAQVGSKVSLVSAVTLTWSATSGFIAVQQALDVIWESQERSFVARRIMAFGMLFVLFLFMVVSALVMAFYPVFSTRILVHARLFHWVTHIYGVSRIIFPASLFLGSLVLYRLFPSKTAPFEFLIPGALVTTVALDAGRELFVWYATHLIHTQVMIYGSLALTMLLVLWMYIASIVMLFGAEVSSVLYQMSLERSANP